MKSSIFGGSGSLLSGLIPSALTILSISTLIGLGLFLAAEIWLAPHHVARLITPTLEQHDYMVAALSQRSALDTKQLARARQDLFCNDVHPVTLSGARRHG